MWYNKAYTLLRSLWEGYKFLIPTVVYLRIALALGRKETWLRKVTDTIWSHFVTILCTILCTILFGTLQLSL